MKTFTFFKQLILQSGVYVLFPILITNYMSHPWVCNVRVQVFGGFKSQKNNCIQLCFRH